MGSNTNPTSFWVLIFQEIYNILGWAQLQTLHLFGCSDSRDKYYSGMDSKTNPIPFWVLMLLCGLVNTLLAKANTH